MAKKKSKTQNMKYTEAKKNRELRKKAELALRLRYPEDYGSNLSVFRDELNLAETLSHYILAPHLCKKPHKEKHERRVCYYDKYRKVKKCDEPIVDKSICFLRCLELFRSVRNNCLLDGIDLAVLASDVRVNARSLILHAALGMSFIEQMETIVQRSETASKKASSGGSTSLKERKLIAEYLFKVAQPGSRKKSSEAVKISALLAKGSFPGVDRKLILSSRQIRTYI